MSTMTLARPLMFRGTVSASPQGKSFERARVTGVQQIIAAPTIEQQLGGAMLQATAVIRESTRDLGNERAQALVTRVAELLHPDEWDEQDEILKVGSVRTLMRVLIALDAETGGVAITRAGNLAASWSAPEGNLRVEALPNGSVSWALIRRSGDAIEAKHMAADTIANLRSACAA